TLTNTENETVPIADAYKISYTNDILTGFTSGTTEDYYFEAYYDDRKYACGGLVGTGSNAGKCRTSSSSSYSSLSYDTSSYYVLNDRLLSSSDQGIFVETNNLSKTTLSPLETYTFPVGYIYAADGAYNYFTDNSSCQPSVL